MLKNFLCVRWRAFPAKSTAINSVTLMNPIKRSCYRLDALHQQWNKYDVAEPAKFVQNVLFQEFNSLMKLHERLQAVKTESRATAHTRVLMLRGFTGTRARHLWRIEGRDVKTRARSASEGRWPSPLVALQARILDCPGVTCQLFSVPAGETERPPRHAQWYRRRRIRTD